MVTDLLFNLFKIFAVFFIVYAMWVLKKYVYGPWKIRQHYIQYKNVKCTKKYIPMLGDITLMIENEQNGKGWYNHWIEEVIEDPEIDFRLLQVTNVSILEFCSLRALDEAEKLIPFKIDRHTHEFDPIGKLMAGSFVVSKSSEGWEQRRKFIMKQIGLNNCSQYTKLMYDEFDKALKEVKVGQEIDMTDFFSKIAFGIFSIIFFGSKIKEKMQNCLYIDPYTGKEEVIPYDEFFFRVARSALKAFADPKGKFLSFLADRELIEPYKTSARNCRHIIQLLKEYFNSHLEEDSICNQMYRSGDFSAEVCVMDSMLMLFAGYENTSRLVSATLYNLKFRPEIMKKLKEAMVKSKLDRPEELNKDELKDAIYNCDYLTYVMKETLRFDNPLAESVNYDAEDDFELFGVKIPKGQRLSLNIYYPHFNPKEWHKPLEFMPERFDPSSEYFAKPGTNEARHPKSLNAFSYGLRNCAGQILAKYEFKVMLSRFLLKADYITTGSFAKNKERKFCFIEAATLSGKITKVDL